MKIRTSLCFAVSVVLTLNQVSSAQQQNQRAQSQGRRNSAADESQAQHQQGQSNAKQQDQNSQQGSSQSQSVSSPQSSSQQQKGNSQGKNGHNYPQTQMRKVWGENQFGSWIDLNQGSGMSLVSVDDALRDHLKLPKGQGLVVTALDGSSPEAHAGIQLNDVLLKLGEAPLRQPGDLDSSLKNVGENVVSLSLIRHGSESVIKVRPQIRVTLGPAPLTTHERPYWIGVSVSAIEPAMASRASNLPRGCRQRGREPQSRGKSGNQGP